MQRGLQNQFPSFQHGLEPKMSSRLSEQNLPFEFPQEMPATDGNACSSVPRKDELTQKVKSIAKKSETTGKGSIDNEMGATIGTKLAKASKKISKNAPALSSQNGTEKRKTRKTWQPHEDLLLAELANKHGLNWALISEDMGRSRTGKQIRDRYLNQLCPNINKTRWTPDEDDLLLQLYKILGNKWCDISKRMPGRTEVMVKNRFYSRFREVFKGNPVAKIEIDDSNFAMTETSRSDTALPGYSSNDNPTTCLNLSQEKPFSEAKPLPIPYNSMEMDRLISFKENLYFAPQNQLDITLKTETNQSESDRVEYDDVPFIDFNAQTNQITKIEDDLEAVIFNNKAVEMKTSINEVSYQQPTNQHVFNYNHPLNGCGREVPYHQPASQYRFNYNHCYQQGYNPIPKVNFDENILRRMQAQQFIQRFSNVKNIFWNTQNYFQ